MGEERGHNRNRGRGERWATWMPVPIRVKGKGRRQEDHFCGKGGRHLLTLLPFDTGGGGGRVECGYRVSHSLCARHASE